MSEYFFGASDKGRQRDNNEDLFFAKALPGGALVAACVIDGVGGYEGGEVAAKIAHDTLIHYLESNSQPGIKDLEAAVAEANRQIIAAKRNAPQLEDMACVLTLVVADDVTNKLAYVHVGDTRAYLFRDGSLVKITKDQSFVGFLEDEGRISEADAMQHPKRNEIDRALGFAAQISSVGYFETGSSPFLPGDVLLLCSDGLTDMVGAAEITRILNSDTSLKQQAAGLIAAANRAGGNDNITVVLVRHRQARQAQKPLKPMPGKDRKEHVAVADADVAQRKIQKVEASNDETFAGINKSSYKAVIASLSVVCIALAAVAAYLWFRPASPEVVEAKQVTPSKTAQSLSNLIASFAGDTLTIPDSLSGNPITLNDTIFIEQDSLHVRGNGLRLIGDSAYNGPAFVLSGSCKAFSIDSVLFQNMAVCIAASGQSVGIKNSAFQNCTVSIQYGFSAQDSVGAERVITDSLPLSKQRNRK